MSIGARIRARRRSLDWSQTVLAQRSGVHVISIVRIERGRQPKPVTLAKLAQALDVSVEALVSSSATPSANSTAA